MPEPVGDGDFVDDDTFEEQEPSSPPPGQEDGPDFEDEGDFEEEPATRGPTAAVPPAPPPEDETVVDEEPRPAPVRPPGRTVAVPDIPPRQPPGQPAPVRPAPSYERAAPPPSRPMFGPRGRPQAPPKPPLNTLPPEKRRELREKLMEKTIWYFVALGMADVIVWALPILWTNIWINLGMCIANLAVIAIVLMMAQPHMDAGRAEMSGFERTRTSRVLMGLMIIMLVPIHEVFGILPLGYYSPSWSTYGWLGLLNPALMLLGAMIAAFSIQSSRERIGYFAIWRSGVLILLLAPLFALIQLAAPVLIYPEWFHQTVGLIGGTVMVIAFMLRRQRNRQFSELETAMRWGDELASRGQLEQAIVQYDTAINMAHTLYSHLIFNPDSPYLSVRVPPAYSEPWFRKGRALVRLRRHKKALAIFEMIIEMDPSNQIALLNASEVMTDMEDFLGALGAVDRVLRIVPGHPDALRLRDSIAAAGRKAAEERERAEAAETVFGPSTARPPPVAHAEGEFLDE